MKSTRSCRNER